MNQVTLARGWPAKSPEFRKALFNLDESHHERVKALAICGEWFVRAIANNDSSRGRCLMIAGDPGTGKTHVARGIYRYVGAFGPDIAVKFGWHPMATWVDWSDVAEADKQEKFEDVVYELDRSKFFILDDIGSESDRFKNGVAASRLRRILSRNEGKWIVATTNLTQTECFEFYDARIVDRLKEFHWFQMKGVPSYRGKREHRS